MFNLSGSEIVIILLLALVILVPDKLPDFMRKAGRTWGELRRMSNSFQDEVRKGFDEPSRELRQTASQVKKAATISTNPVKGAVQSLLEPPATARAAPSQAAATDGPATDGPAVDEPAVEPAPATDAVIEAPDAPAPRPADDPAVGQA